MNHQIIKTDNGKFALFVNGIFVADYTRKADAKRGYARYLARTERQTAADNVQTVIVPQAETPLNHACRITGQAFYLLQKVDLLFSAHEPQKGIVRTPALTQRTSVRGTARAAARSPPRLIGGERLTTPCLI